MAGGPAQKCQVSARGSRSSAPGCARATAGALGPARAAQRQPLLQSRLQVWQCGFTLYAPPPPPRPRSSSSAAAAFLPPARSLGAAGGSAELPPPPATCGPGAAVQARSRGRCEGARSGELRGRPGALDRSAAPLLLPGSEAAARASSRLARSFGGAYTCVTDRAESQLLPGSAADVSDPQPLGGRIVQAE